MGKFACPSGVTAQECVACEHSTVNTRRLPSLKHRLVRHQGQGGANGGSMRLYVLGVLVHHHGGKKNLGNNVTSPDNITPSTVL